ncbi:MAG: ABC transporter ATP-binding protein [Chloroflexi bacterium]|nr:ABC transporter ATP-binding protein [Chloroflexota bacterium]
MVASNGSMATQSMAHAVKASSSSALGAIQVEGVGKVYPSRRGAASIVAVKDVSFSVAAGEFVSLVGPSGCGKSTMLMAIAGLTQPSGGRVVIDGQPVTAPRRSVGVMFQTPELFRWRNVLENVLLPVDVFGLNRAAYLERARELLRLAGLGAFEHAYPQELSGGMEQRTALCRVLVADPSIVLMDEPFGALDEFTRERLNIELLRIWDATRKTVVFVTHNIGEAVFLSDRVIVMGTQPGRVLEDVQVPLPRPRTVESMRERPYHETLYHIRDLLGLSH